MKDKFEDAASIFNSPRTSQRSIDTCVENLFEKDVSEALGFSDGEKEHNDLNKEGGVLTLLLILNLYEMFKDKYKLVYDSKKKYSREFQFSGYQVFKNMIDISSNI